MLVRLEVSGGPDKGREFELVQDGVYVLGRSTKCHLSIPSDRHISQAHMAFRVDSSTQTCTWKQLPEARNAVSVNAQILTSGKLKTGDRIKLGFAEINFSADWQRQVSFYSCVECDRSVYLLQSDIGRLRKVVCDECRQQTDQAPRTIERFNCRDCGRDVREQANRDQLAFEYHGLAEYLCDDCASKFSTSRSCKGSSTNYQLLRELGQGGMGVVFLGRCELTGRLVAVKHATGGEQRFEREMLLMQRLRHPNIVRYIDWTGSDAPRLIMQYVSGPSLHDLMIDEFDAISITRRLEIFGQIINAVAFMHSQVGSRIIHRDLKPENVLIQVSPDSGYQAFVTDFGLGCDLDESRLTRYGVRMGTPAFTAPEQMRNARNANERSDVYALGVLGYYMISGELPFGLPSPLEASIEARIKGLDFSDRDTLLSTQDELTRGRGLGDSFQDAAFRSILKKHRPALRMPKNVAVTGIRQTLEIALAIDPEQRFESATTMQQHFQRHVNSNPAAVDINA